MSTLQSELENNLSDFLRTAARQYGDTVTQFGEAFVAYGKGEIDAAGVAQTTLKLAAGEARRAVETGIGLGSSYVNWVTSLVGIKDLKQQAPGVSESKPPPAKTVRK